MTIISSKNLTDQTIASLPSTLGYPLNDTECIIQLYSQALTESPESICRRLHHEELHFSQHHLQEFSALGIERHVWSEKLEQFYKNSDTFLMGCVPWNRRPEKIKMRQWIGAFLAKQNKTPLDLLTIGDGAGFDSLYFAQCGHHVTYSEVSDSAFEFARRMFQKCGQSISMIQDITEIKDHAYDVITCLDVLEHVPNPTELVECCARYLRPGGMLIVHAPFFYLSSMVPTHLKANRRYAGDLRKLYHPYGFRLVDGSAMWDPIVLQKTDSKEPMASANSAHLFGLRLSGLLLAVGRYWSGVHNLIVHRMVRKGDPRWLREFEASPHFRPNSEPTNTSPT